MGIPMGAAMPCYQGKVSCNLSQHIKQPQEESVAQNPAQEPPKAPSPGPFQGPTQQSSCATLKVLVTPAKWAPSLGPGPLTSKKAKASVSKSRPKTPLVAQKAKFGIDVGVTPSETIPIYHPLAGPPSNPSPRLLPSSSLQHPSTPP
ncbi:hypothetical protein PAXRUDRAFT_15025 [Paxillus rubicundulus Ve08.2h10]|uniref:Uncharacterized protein n=1 Tax=Paxillus rubicundulus Ve08.2h10 TaxID=930991 RepID=A0A0D0DJQ2_9AGAM|nr:hypothetical protein PAXRUDRAFT_15025 [Paxillus rubicundulus Ve08.2h10]